MKVCLICIAKKENRYIKEWVDWNLGYGFDKIIICENNDPDGERIADVIDNEKVEIRDYIGIRPVQGLAYNTEFKKEVNNFDWLFICDCDEYIVLDDKYLHDVHNFLEDSMFSEADTIRLNWMIFSGGSEKDVKDGDYSVVKRFTERYTGNKFEEKLAKNFYRTSKLKDCQRVSTHFIKESSDVFNAAGERCSNGYTNGREPCYRNAWLNHYPTKTMGEFIRQKYFNYGPNDPKRYSGHRLRYFFKYNKPDDELKEYGEKLIEEIRNNYEKSPML